MPKAAASDSDMRLLLLQEAVWNNGDKLSRILEHAIAQEAQLIRLTHRLEQLLFQRDQQASSSTKNKEAKS